jgi:tetratricopeptide (TPR) repeat protein
MEMERFEDALSSYGRAVVLDPITRSSSIRRYTDALDCYGDALALRPDYDGAQINRGVTLNELTRHHEALLCFDQLPARVSDHADALQSRPHLGEIGSVRTGVRHL